MSLKAEDLDDLCSPSYLDGLEDAPVVDLRTRREACEGAELALSYLRRVLQAEIDLVLAELDQRASAGQSDLGRLVDELPKILASPPPGGQQPAHTPVMASGVELGDEVALEELLEGVLAEAGSLPGGAASLLVGANVCTFSDAEITDSLARLREVEKSLSSRRRILHEHIDAIQAAIVDRYKSGAADPDSLLS